MAKNQSKRIDPDILEADDDTFTSLKTLSTSIPSPIMGWRKAVKPGE